MPKLHASKLPIWRIFFPDYSLLGELEGKRIKPDPSDIAREVGNKMAGICLIGLNDPEASLSATGNGIAAGGGRPSGGEFAPGPTVSLPGPPTICFHGNQTVDVLGRGQIAMENLQIDDMVGVGNGKYSTVYSFGHYENIVKAKYLQIRGRDLEKPLEISNDHMVFVQKVCHGGWR